jgi:DNA-binding response OmpR family regulator
MKPKILYVEDEPHLGKIVTDIIERQDFEVLLINDGTEAIESFKSFVPDICILDIMLPGVDGLELAQLIRNKNPHLPIIFLSAKTQTNDVLKGFECGGNDYIKKPFSIEELIVRIKNPLKISASGRNEQSHQLQEIKIRDVIFYPEKYELHIQNRIIKLSYREGQILSAFTSSPNKIIDRKSIAS